MKPWLYWTMVGGMLAALVAVVALIKFGLGGTTHVAEFSASRFEMRHSSRTEVLGVVVPMMTRVIVFKSQVTDAVVDPGGVREDWVVLRERNKSWAHPKTRWAFEIMNPSFFLSGQQGWMDYLEKDPVKAKEAIRRVAAEVGNFPQAPPEEIQARLYWAVKDDPDAMRCLGADKWEMPPPMKKGEAKAAILKVEVIVPKVLAQYDYAYLRVMHAGPEVDEELIELVDDPTVIPGLEYRQFYREVGAVARCLLWDRHDKVMDKSEFSAWTEANVEKIREMDPKVMAEMKKRLREMLGKKE
jgi:hypothetical protein